MTTFVAPVQQLHCVELLFALEPLVSILCWYLLMQCPNEPFDNSIYNRPFNPTLSATTPTCVNHGSKKCEEMINDNTN